MADATNGGTDARAAAVDDGRDPRERRSASWSRTSRQQTSTLVRQEIELAQAELQQKGKIAGKGAGMLGGAAVCRAARARRADRRR